MKLYKIWKTVSAQKDPRISYVTYDAQNKTISYSLVETISVLHYDREDIVSMDFPRIEKFCAYLNEMADSNEHYKIVEHQKES